MHVKSSWQRAWYAVSAEEMLSRACESPGSKWAESLLLVGKRESVGLTSKGGKWRPGAIFHVLVSKGCYQIMQSGVCCVLCECMCLSLYLCLACVQVGLCMHLKRCFRTRQDDLVFSRNVATDAKRKCPFNGLNISQHKESSASPRSFPGEEWPLISFFYRDIYPHPTVYEQHSASRQEWWHTVINTLLAPTALRVRNERALKGVQLHRTKGPHKMLPFGSTRCSLHESWSWVSVSTGQTDFIAGWDPIRDPFSVCMTWKEL